MARNHASRKLHKRPTHHRRRPTTRYKGDVCWLALIVSFSAHKVNHYSGKLGRCEKWEGRAVVGKKRQGHDKRWGNVRLGGR